MLGNDIFFTSRREADFEGGTVNKITVSGPTAMDHSLYDPSSMFQHVFLVFSTKLNNVQSRDTLLWKNRAVCMEINHRMICDLN